MEERSPLLGQNPGELGGSLQKNECQARLGVRILADHRGNFSASPILVEYHQFSRHVQAVTGPDHLLKLHAIDDRENGLAAFPFSGGFD